MIKMRCSTIGLVTPALALLLTAAGPEVRAENLRFDAKSDWEKWSFPMGTVELTEDGWIRPVFIRQNINASLDAGDFVVERDGSTPIQWGGIAGVGSNASLAAHIFDGDPNTGWGPDPQDDMENWWIELDLGRLVSATSVVLKFAPDVEPFEMFKVYASTGEEALYSGSGVKEYRLVGQTTQPNSAYEIEYPLGLLGARSSTAAEPRQLVAFVLVQVTAPSGDARLAEVEVHSLGDNVVLGTVERGGSALQASPGGDRRILINNDILDGSYNTFWNSSAGFLDWTEKGWVHLDLGALFWVDTIRIVSTTVHQGSRVQALFGYKLFISDGTTGPTAQIGTENVMGSFVWQEVGSVDDNSDLILTFEDTFEKQPVQHIFFSHRNNVRDTGTYGQFKTLEIEAYGEGYVPGVTLTSGLIDLGRTKNVTNVEWNADIAPGTALEIRTRTGDQLADKLHYFDKKGNELTFERWDQLPGFRKEAEPVVEKVPDPETWSPWSTPYLHSGDVFASPTPRRYLQMRANLLSEAPNRALSLDHITLTFSEPFARSLLAEVWPNEAVAAQLQEFSYFVLPTFGGGDKGFDRMLIKTPSQAELVDVKIGDELVGASVLPSGPDSLLLQLESQVSASELVHVRLKTKVFLNGTLFEGAVSHSDDPDFWQGVDPGDASLDVTSNELTVFVPITDRLIDNLDIVPRVISPNGDGVNDEMSIGFSVLQVDKAQPIIVTVHDLAGRVVRQLRDQPGVGGDYHITWDGRNGAGALVQPGMYLCRVKLEASREEEGVVHSIAVVF